MRDEMAIRHQRIYGVLYLLICREERLHFASPPVAKAAKDSYESLSLWVLNTFKIPHDISMDLRCCLLMNVGLNNETQRDLYVASARNACVSSPMPDAFAFIQGNVSPKNQDPLNAISFSVKHRLLTSLQRPLWRSSVGQM